MRVCAPRGVRSVGEEVSMRATHLIILGAAWQVCCGRSLYGDFDKISPRGRHLHPGPQANKRREAPRSWFVSGGGAEVEREGPPTRWWRSRKRWAKRQAEKKAAEEQKVAALRASQLARKHVLAVQGMLRRLRRLLGLIVDITTLKRLRLLRQARQVRRPSACFVASCSQSAAVG